MYCSIKLYRGAKDDKGLKFWQKYWSARSIFLLVDYLVWPYLEGFEIFYLIKIGLYFCLSYLGLAEIVYDRIIMQIYSEAEPYVDTVLQHTTLTQYFTLWRGNFYKFFIEELEEFLVPN